MSSSHWSVSDVRVGDSIARVPTLYLERVSDVILGGMPRAEP
jgi:hypothetical protein